MHEYHKAVEDFTIVLEKERDNVCGLFLRGKAKQHIENYESHDTRIEAVNDFTSAIKFAPEFSYAYSSRASVYANMNKNQEALEDLNTAIKYNPECKFYTHYTQGGISDLFRGMPIDILFEFHVYGNFYKSRKHIYGRLGWDNESIEREYIKATEIEAKTLEKLKKEGFFYYRESRYKESIDYLNTAIKISPRNHSFYIYRADVFCKLYDYDSSIRDYTKAISLQTEKNAFDFGDALRKRADIYYDLGRYEDAISDYSEAYNIDPESKSHILLKRGHSFLKIKEYELAVQDYNVYQSLSEESIACMFH